MAFKKKRQRKEKADYSLSHHKEIVKKRIHLVKEDKYESQIASYRMFNHPRAHKSTPSFSHHPLLLTLSLWFLLICCSGFAFGSLKQVSASKTASLPSCGQQETALGALGDGVSVCSGANRSVLPIFRVARLHKVQKILTSFPGAERGN